MARISFLHLESISSMKSLMCSKCGLGHYFHGSHAGYVSPVSVCLADVVADVLDLYPLLHFSWQTLEIGKNSFKLEKFLILQRLPRKL